MTISAKLKAMLGRVFYAVPPGFFTAQPAVLARNPEPRGGRKIIPARDIVGNIDDLIAAGKLEFYRNDSDGQNWFTVLSESLNPAVAACAYVPESRLPGDADDMIRAEAIQPWRVDPTTGERWFRADAGTIEDWSPNQCRVIHDDDPGADFDPEADFYDADFEDPDTDPFAELPDPDGYPDGYPEAWKAR